MKNFFISLARKEIICCLIFIALSAWNAASASEDVDVAMNSVEIIDQQGVELSGAEVAEFESIQKQAGCPTCPILFGDFETGISYTRAPNEGLDQSLKWTRVTALTTAAAGGLEFKKFRIAAELGGEFVIIIPAYLYYGGYVEALLNKKGNLYFRGKIFRTHYINNMNRAPDATLVGGQIGFGKRDRSRAGLSIMKGVNVKWLQVGLRLKINVD